jgi:F0F1-type ATP synthase membrane subunit b/b'
MADVVNLFEVKKTAAEKKEDRKTDDKEQSLEEIIKKNKQKMERERNQANKRILRNYRIKS